MLRMKKLLWIGLASMAVWLVSIQPAPALQLGSRPAADWIQTLERAERVAGLKIDEIITNLNLKPGMVIADIGSGSGVFSRPLAKAIAPDGKVYAVDIEPGLLSYVKERAMKENIPNIETHLGEIDDAKLPGQIVDLIFIHDVLHHIEHRDVYLKNLAQYIKPDGRIALIEMDSTDSEGPHRNQPEMLVSKEHILEWFAAAGFHPAQEINLFPGKKLFFVFSRHAQPTSSQESMDMDMMDDMGMDHEMH